MNADTFIRALFACLFLLAGTLLWLLSLGFPPKEPFLLGMALMLHSGTLAHGMVSDRTLTAARNQVARAVYGLGLIALMTRFGPSPQHSLLCFVVHIAMVWLCGLFARWLWRLDAIPKL